MSGNVKNLKKLLKNTTNFKKGVNMHNYVNK